MERRPEINGKLSVKKVKVSFKVIRSFTLDVLSSDTIGSIKGNICRIEGASIDQQELFFEGNHLEDTKTLSDYNFSPDSSIDVHVDGRMQISIKIPSMEKTFTLNVTYMATVHKLKVMIQDAVGIQSDQQLLVFCGNSLKDDQVLISCGVMNDSTIYVMLNPLAEILLYVHVSSGDTFSLEVMAGCTIRDVKIIVESLKGIPANQQKLLHDNVELQDSFSLLSYKIMHKSVLQLQVPMQIFVKTATGKTITLMVEASDTISLIITKIVNKMGFKWPNLKLFYDGKLLQEQNTVASYRIQRESTIYQR